MSPRPSEELRGPRLGVNCLLIDGDRVANANRCTDSLLRKPPRTIVNQRSAGFLISLFNRTSSQIRRSYSMLRKLILCVVLAPAIGAVAQQSALSSAKEGSNWQNVQSLPVGATIEVKARTRHANCKLKSVDADYTHLQPGKGSSVSAYRHFDHQDPTPRPLYAHRSRNRHRSGGNCRCRIWK